MEKGAFKNILGTFAYDNGTITPGGNENLPLIDSKLQLQTLSYFKKPEYFPALRKNNWEQTVKDLKASVTDDLLIIQIINSMDELDRVINLLTGRVRDWFSLYAPEVEFGIEDNEQFISSIVAKNRQQLLQDVKAAVTMGADFSKENLESMLTLAREVNDMISLRNNYTNDLDRLEKTVCPNVAALAGATIAAKLLRYAGSMKRLALFPASTIQTLGAEKALFRHLRNKKKNKSPKYGVLHEHAAVQKSKRNEAGKAARILADKISLAARVDYFKGKFVGDKLKQDVIKKIGISW